MLAERADALDLAEISIVPHVEEKSRQMLGKNRAELDAVLAQPVGKQALAEAALLRELGGAA